MLKYAKNLIIRYFFYLPALCASAVAGSWHIFWNMHDMYIDQGGMCVRCVCAEKMDGLCFLHGS